MSDRKLNGLLWVLQVLLAMLFMFAGVMKARQPTSREAPLYANVRPHTADCNTRFY